MTPVLIGRWQTRTFIMTVFGIPVTLAFALLWHDMRNPFAALGYVLLVGLILDMLWDQIQRRRWEGDFPPVLHVASGATEGLVVWALIKPSGCREYHRICRCTASRSTTQSHFSSCSVCCGG